MELKERLKFLQEHLRLNQTQFAELIGIGKTTINNYLTGISEPTFKQLLKILKEIPELQAEWLMRGEGNPFKNTLIQNVELFENMNPINEQLHEEQKDYKNLNAQKKEPTIDIKESKPTEMEIILKKLEMIQIEMWRLNDRIDKLENK